jgi:hypothetical protein
LFRGLPLAQCHAICAPTPGLLYQCVGGRCVNSSTGVSHADCTQICEPPSPPAPPGAGNAYQVVRRRPDLSTLVTALAAGNLSDGLSGSGPVTVFAPTNEAFDALPPTLNLTHLLQPTQKDQLDTILKYHVVVGESLYATSLKSGQQIKTLQGQTLFVRFYQTEAEPRLCERKHTPIRCVQLWTAWPRVV